MSASGGIGLVFAAVFLLGLLFGDLGSLGRTALDEPAEGSVAARRARFTRGSTLVAIVATVPLAVFMVLRFIDLAS